MSPLYDFKCPSCSAVVDVIVPVGSRTEPMKCVKCGEWMRKQPSSFAVRVGTEARNPNHPDSVQRANEERRQKGLRADIERVKRRDRVQSDSDL